MRVAEKASTTVQRAPQAAHPEKLKGSATREASSIAPAQAKETSSAQPQKTKTGPFESIKAFFARLGVILWNCLCFFSKKKSDASDTEKQAEGVKAKEAEGVKKKEMKAPKKLSKEAEAFLAYCKQENASEKFQEEIAEFTQIKKDAQAVLNLVQQNPKLRDDRIALSRAIQTLTTISKSVRDSMSAWVLSTASPDQFPYFISNLEKAIAMVDFMHENRTIILFGDYLKGFFNDYVNDKTLSLAKGAFEALSDRDVECVMGIVYGKDVEMLMDSSKGREELMTAMSTYIKNQMAKFMPKKGT